MGTTCDLKWREADDRERLWVIDPTHQLRLDYRRILN